MKPVAFLGGSLDALRRFPEAARGEAGYQLERVQRGLEPNDWKPLRTIGPGVCEIRIREASGAYRVIYVANFSEAVYVLHAFQRKTRATARRDLDLAAVRLRGLMVDRR